jgi:cytochrome c
MNLFKSTLGLSLALGLALPLAAAKPDPATEAMMKKSDCFTCHSVAKKIVGPAYKDVAKKYKSDPKAAAMLVDKVKKGGAGHWGQVPMAAHPNLKDADIKAMVTWVLAQK